MTGRHRRRGWSGFRTNVKVTCRYYVTRVFGRGHNLTAWLVLASLFAIL